MSQATWKKTTITLTPRVLRLLREVSLYLLAAVGVYLLIGAVLVPGALAP